MRVVVVWKAGPTWTSGGVREQPGWEAHAEFIDALIDKGTFVMGGPFADNSGSMSLLEGVTADEARGISPRIRSSRMGSSCSTTSANGTSSSTNSRPASKTQPSRAAS